MLAGTDGGTTGVRQLQDRLPGDLAGLVHTVGLLGRGGVGFAFSAERRPAQHTAACQENAGDIQPRSRHQHTGHRFIAGAHQHQAVQTMRPSHNLDAVRHDFTGGQRVAGAAVGGADAIANGDAAEFHRCAACTVDAVFHLLGQLPQILVAGNDIGEGVADADDGARKVVVGKAVRFVQRAAGDHAVRHKGAGGEFILHGKASLLSRGRKVRHMPV